MRRHLYRHHGFILSSNAPLSRLSAAPDGAVADISVEALAPGALAGRGRSWVMTDPPTTSWRAATECGSQLRLRYARDAEWAEFVIDEYGESVWISRGDGIVLDEVAELLLGPVFSCVLAQRGMTCLHAATVRIAGRVVAIAGPSGAGKSTTALGLVQRGGVLIADDVAALSPDHEAPSVLPGASRLRMRPDAAECLVGSFAGLDSMWVQEERRPAKRYLHVDEPASDDGAAWPLDAVYLLVPDGAIATPAINELTPSHALGRLMALRHVVGALDATAHRRDFRAIARVAQSVTVRELRRPDGLASAPAIVGAILADLEHPD